MRAGAQSHSGFRKMETGRKLGPIHVEAEKRIARGWEYVNRERSGVSLYRTGADRRDERDGEGMVGDVTAGEDDAGSCRVSGG